MAEDDRDPNRNDQRQDGRLTDDLLEEKLREGKGPLPFIPGGDGDKIEPPLPASHREAD